MLNMEKQSIPRPFFDAYYESCQCGFLLIKSLPQLEPPIYHGFYSKQSHQKSADSLLLIEVFFSALFVTAKGKLFIAFVNASRNKVRQPPFPAVQAGNFLATRWSLFTELL